MFLKQVMIRGAIALALMAKAASSQPLTVPTVPEKLRVPDGNVAFAIGNAVGTQNYVCLPSGEGLAWKFQGPQATVFLTIRFMNREVRHQIMTHFLSPNPEEAGMARATWMSSMDTSAVWARKIEESSDSAYVEAGAIPWFLLQRVGKQSGPTGGSLMGKTTYIQRINTTGGIVPEGGCSEAGKIAFVPYTADYVFYQAR